MLVCLVFFLFANDYFSYICIFFIFYLQLGTYIYNIYYIYIIFLFIIVNENVSIKSTKFGAGWNNFCRLNDFKESDKIVFEEQVYMPNN